MVDRWGAYLSQPRAVSIYVQHYMRRKCDEPHGEGLAVGL